MVQLNADGLEGALGRVASLGPYPGRDGGLDDLHQLIGGFDPFLLARFHNVLCNIFRKPVLTVITDDPVQLGRFFVSLVHTHIQRRVFPVGKAPLCRIQLIGGYAQVQVDPVHFFDPQAGQHLFYISVIAPDDGNLLSVFLKPPRSCLDGVCILVDADETAFGAQPL